MAEPRRPRYRRPVLPWERKGGLGRGAARWSAAGLEFGFGVVLFFLGGRFVDAKLGTEPWLTVTGSLIGVAVGTYLLVRPALRAPPTEPPSGRQPPGTDPPEKDPTAD